MMSCVFCQIIKGTLPSYTIWSDSRFVAFLDLNPIQRGHVLLVPREHIDNAFSLDQESYAGLFDCARQLEPSLCKALKAKRLGLVMEGFGVPHAHLHLVPINEGNQLDPNKARRADSKDLEELALVIKREISAKN